MFIDMLQQRQRFAADPHRPRYHFLPPANWMNDPNGVIQWKSQYHLFYQHNPNSALWGDMHWGHAVSVDLVRWTDCPVALAPTPGGPDEAGCFSGCAVNHDGVPTLIYTGTRGQQNEIQTQCIAIGSDDLMAWQKYAGNPVLDRIPDAAHQSRDFRDPFVWKENDGWYMVVGSRIQDVGGAVFLYRSHNLIDWHYLHPLLIGDIHRNGVTWECPNFFKLGDQWVLIISSHMGTYTGKVIYFTGQYENQVFTPTSEGVLDYGELYAPLTLLDDQNRRILFGWLRESRPPEAQARAGWSGVQAVPRVLDFNSHGCLTMKPVPGIESIRGQHHHFDAGDLHDDAVLEAGGLALDIRAEFQPDAAGNYGLRLVHSSDGAEQTDIIYDAAKHRLRVGSIPLEGGSTPRTERVADHALTAGEPLLLRILVDGSVVEIIANERTSLVHRVYPSHTDHNRIQLLGAAAQIRSLDIWEMLSIWQ